MNSTTPLTQAELVEVMEHYIQPFYQIIGGALAGFFISIAVIFVFSGVKALWKRLGL